MTFGKKLVCLLVVLVALAGMALAQGVATADVRGTITDPQGAVVIGATVTLRDRTRNFARSTTTNAAGEYLMLAVPPGVYEVTVEAQGFARIVTSGATLTVGQAAQLDLGMKLAGTAETIEVAATPELVETQRSTASTTIQQTRIDNLPINGRSYIFFTLTNSQVARDTAPAIGVAPTSGLNFGGQRARSNLVNVDGADAVDNSTNGIRSTVSQEAVQEFQILTNGYAAEYGRASGGVVNIITRRGTNDLHGNLFGYLRHRSIQADNPFTTTPDPAFTRVQAGATLGGPIKKDRTFFFFSYETTRRQETGFSTIGADNFGLIDASAAFGAPAGSGTFLLTQEQIAFLGANPGLAPFFPTYLGLTGRASGMALSGAWPLALGGLSAFPTTCAPPLATFGCPSLANPVPVPGDYVPLNSVVGNYPISEGTTVVALRLDHQFNANQQGLLRVNVSPSTVTGIQVNGQNQVFGQNSYSRTSEQTFRDVNVVGQHTWTIGNNKINEFRFQYARRGLLYTFSRQGDSSGPFGDTGTNPDGGQVAINISGSGFFGREPFSFADRSEQRYQFTDSFSWLKGNHTIKFGADINHIPIEADFTVNFGGLYNIGGLSSATVFAGAIAANPVLAPLANFPAFSPVQAYGLGIPANFIQQVGDPSYSEANKTFGFFLQDSWRIKPSFTLNIGVRYDLELTPTEAARTPLAEATQQALGITQGIPRDKNNVAPRIGFAWDPWKDGKTVIRGSYGLFYDHPLFGIAFLSQVSDGDQAPGLAIIPAAPTNPALGCNLNAVNMFQGLLNCPASFGYLPQEMRFDAFLPNSVFVNQNFLNPMSFQPLVFLPFGFQTQKDFVYAYSHQASFGIERDMGGNFALSVGYNFNGGRHLNRSVNVNPVDTEALIVNWERAIAAGQATVNTNPQSVAGCGVGPLGPFVPAALVNFFRPSGINPSLAPVFALNPMLAPCLNVVVPLLGIDPAGQNIFSDQSAHHSIGSSVYHGLTANLRKRMSKKYEFLISYTWSHAIDDSTDLQSPLAPQDNRRPDLERSRSSFDQRHRLVLSGVYQSGKLSGDGFFSKFFSDWTVAPIIEVSSGRPFNILVGADANFDAGSLTDRPSIVPAGSSTPVGCLPPAASSFSPTGFLQPACFNDGVIDGVASNPLVGNLGRNAGTRPFTYFTDMRLARRFHMTERWKLDVVADMFNIINRFNVADVNLLYQDAGRPTASFDARQFQFALKLSW